MESNRFRRPSSLLPLALAALVVAALGVIYVLRDRGEDLPAPPSRTYEDATRAFYRGLASLHVGLLDEAGRQFTRATELARREPAAWANLGLTRLRLGELDAAAEPIERAVQLAPGNSDLVLLAGRMESARGRLDEAVARLRQAAELDPSGLRARFALAEELERGGGNDDEVLALLDGLVERAPGNLAVILERARVASRRGDAARLRDSVSRLEPTARSWPAVAAEQFRGLRVAASSGDFTEAARATLLLRNVLARVPAYLESLAAVRTPAELIAEPFEQFLALERPSASASPADASLRFDPEPFEGNAGGVVHVAALWSAGDDPPLVLALDESQVRRLGQPGQSVWPLPAGTAAGPASAHRLVPLDWNHDFLVDFVVAGTGGLRLFTQSAGASFTDVTAQAGGIDPVACGCFGAWAADVEMDGDLDIVVGLLEGPTIVLRNNGNGTWQRQQMFAGVTNARAFAWADLDADGDPDAAIVDSSGALHVLVNRQAGDFLRVEPPPPGRVLVALAAADLNADGAFDLVMLDAAGAVRLASVRADVSASAASGAPAFTWEVREIARWPELESAGAGVGPGTGRIFAADVDNSGALDLVASAASGSRVWLADPEYRFEPLGAPIAGEVAAVLDVDADGRLDFLAVEDGRPLRLLGRGDRGYHWKVVRARAQQNAGDQRINSFGVGGEIEIRSGLLTQKQVLTGGPAHFGLGARDAIDVARIIWPNGVPQAEFDLPVDGGVVAEQRLKGSCPWVFAYDGTGMRFVTDFLWRSPLGLRINAQDTAGTTQTEDWVMIRGDQLAARQGFYDVRVTAELWETHFFDHVSLMVVDHPPGTEVYVDERFSAARPPALAVRATGPPRPVLRAWDHGGRDVTELVAKRDGRYLAAFERGAYQGIANEHFVEVELAREASTGGETLLIAHGWVYPTDSSINVAIGQGGHVRPAPVSLEALSADGTWVVVDPDLGFPAGKNKTMLIDLRGAAGARRLRLRTNLEVSWDWIASAAPSGDQPATVRLSAAEAGLVYRGFSETTSPRGESPEAPLYDRIANRTQRWRDLIGYYTRFGEVGELLADVDDRYVIMNAGDELRMRFPEQPAPPAGWRRDYVLIGDGWEKDGDYNTGFSKTVLPLPTHARSAYEAASASLELEDDPVYQQHREDWQRYHTRFVTPDLFLRGVRGR